jgi:hemerythrin-like domain-containing protein
MTKHNIASWIRAEHDKVIDLSNVLRQMVAYAPRENLAAWINETRGCFDHFRAHLIRHMALEEEDGFFSRLTEQRPTLAPEIDRLRHEHVEMTRIMRGIHQTLEELTPEDRLLVRDCCARINGLLSYVDHHEDLEDSLVTFIFTQDIGTKD